MQHLRPTLVALYDVNTKGAVRLRRLESPRAEARWSLSLERKVARAYRGAGPGQMQSSAEITQLRTAHFKHDEDISQH